MESKLRRLNEENTRVSSQMEKYRQGIIAFHQAVASRELFALQDQGDMDEKVHNAPTTCCYCEEAFHSKKLLLAHLPDCAARKTYREQYNTLARIEECGLQDAWKAWQGLLARQ